MVNDRTNQNTGAAAVLYFIVDILFAFHIYTDYQHGWIGVIFWSMFILLCLIMLWVIYILASGQASPANPDGLTRLIVWTMIGLVVYILYDQQYVFAFWAFCVSLTVVEIANIILKLRR